MADKKKYKHEEDINETRPTAQTLPVDGGQAAF